ncbi:MAG: 4Fe-4S binding protein [Anaerolineae bacterium]
MYGLGILKGLGVTFRHFINSYIDDLRYAGKKAGLSPFEVRQGLKAEGIFTVQYPDEKLAVPERFRFVPFLVVEDADHPDRPGHDWCTSCGICAKVCPGRSIRMRGENPETGRPIPEPEAFFIDIDICMNCGFCAEFCPFDAIKMDHDYELASYDRTANHIFDKQKLSVSLFSYWKTIAPTTAAEEAEARGGWEHPDVIKERKKAERGGGPPPRPAAAAAAAAARCSGQPRLKPLLRLPSPKRPPLPLLPLTRKPPKPSACASARKRSPASVRKKAGKGDSVNQNPAE